MTPGVCDGTDFLHGKASLVFRNESLSKIFVDFHLSYIVSLFFLLNSDFKQIYFGKTHYLQRLPRQQSESSLFKKM
jgi:hypothetical protein